MVTKVCAACPGSSALVHEVRNGDHFFVDRFTHRMNGDFGCLLSMDFFTEADGRNCL